MNKDKRLDIQTTISKLTLIKNDIEINKAKVEAMQSDEEDKFENLSEGLQCSDRGMNLEASAFALDSANSSLETAMENIDEAIESLQEAKGY